jgi:hypothetical protein
LRVRPTTTDVPVCVRDAFPEFSQIQPFCSILERLSPEYAGSMFAYKECWVGNTHLSSVERDEFNTFRAHVSLDSGSPPQDVFVKRIHLLDPIRYMEGEYVLPSEGALPAPSELWKSALAKINDPMNEAYVDALFAACASALAESGRSPHWCRSFGTFSARVSNYVYNVTEDYESLRHRPWWRRNQRQGIFSLVKNDDDEDTAKEFTTTGISNIADDDFVEVDADAGGSGDAVVLSPTNEFVITSSEPAIDADSPVVNLAAPKLRLKPLADSSSEDDDDDEKDTDGDSATSGEEDTDAEDSDDDTDTDEILQHVEFTNFPVQVTLLERAEGTMDELLEDEDETDADMLETKDARWGAWLFQVISALTCAQHYYGFVHNDLHTNNIMWSSTTEPYLYYRVRPTATAQPHILRVPTYGKIMKIIDFGRATYHLPDVGGLIIPDAFFPGNDAATQYNCAPFYDPKEGARVEPNPSFDLSRLSVALIEFLYPERPEAVRPVKIMSREGNKLHSETTSPVYNMLWEWLLDDGGHNILRLPSGKERYPDFDLYRAIAAEVHKAVPRHQLARPMYQAYKLAAETDVPAGARVYDLFV